MGEDEPPPPNEITLRRQADYALHSRIFASLPGADSLIKLYGQVPDFHDAEVDRLQLSAKGESTIRVSNPYPDIFSRGRVVVTIGIEEVVYLELDGFNPPNVLFGLRVRPATAKPEIDGYHRRLTNEDIEIELEPSVGIGGTIIARGVSIAWTKDWRARDRK